MSDEEIIIVKDLQAQAGLFDMTVDWETLELVPKTSMPEKPHYLQRWIDRNADKQMDHEFMNRDGNE